LDRTDGAGHARAAANVVVNEEWNERESGTQRKILEKRGYIMALMGGEHESGVYGGANERSIRPSNPL